MGIFGTSFFKKGNAMEKRRFMWKAFLRVFAALILALGLVSCNGGGEPPTGEHPEHPASEGTKLEHPEHPK